MHVLILNRLLLMVLLLGIPSLESERFSTGTYGTFSTSNVFLSPQNEIFVADRHEGFVKVFNPKGKLIRTIGGIGSGPGEFTDLFAIVGDGLHLYCFDFMAARMHRFDHAGKFIDRFKVPRHIFNPRHPARKVYGGWVWKTMSEALVYSDEKFENVVVLSGNYDPNQKHDLSWYQSRDRNLHQAVLLFATSLDGERVYYHEPGLPEIKVYDLKGKTYLNSFKLDIKRYPYNKEHGKEAYEKYKAHRGEGKGSFKFEFPDFYPTLTVMTLNADGTLRVIDGSGMFAKKPNVFTFDLQGKAVDTPFKDHHLSYGTFAIRDNWIYMIGSQDDEIFIERIPRGNIL